MNATITRTRTRSTKPATEPQTTGLESTLLAELEAEYAALETAKSSLESKLKSFGLNGATRTEREDAQQALRACLVDLEAKSHALNGAREAHRLAQLEEERAKALAAAQLESEALGNLRDELDHGYVNLAAKLDELLSQVSYLEALTKSQAAKLGDLVSHQLSRGKHEVNAKRWATLQGKLMAVAYKLLSGSLMPVKGVVEHPDANRARTHAQASLRAVNCVSGLTPLVDVN